MKTAIKTELAPFPLGCYSQAIVVDKMLYLAGQIGLDPTTGALAEGTSAQMTQIFLKMSAVLQAAGSDLDHVVKLTVFLKDYPADRLKLDEVMQQFFTEPYPARSTIGVAALPRDASVEVEAIASLP